MHIDITATPPADIFRHRRRTLWLAGLFLGLAGGGGLLALYAIYSTAPYSRTLEDVALGLLVGPGLVFVYFGEKLQAYKKLTPAQEKELAALSQKHPEIAAYCSLLSRSGRAPILAEFEACQARAEELSRE